MKSKQYHSLFGVSAVMLFFTLLPGVSDAQNGRFGWQRFIFRGADQAKAEIEAAPTILENAKSLNHLARRMESRYGYDLRFTGGCKDSRKLHQQMLRHVTQTSVLVNLVQEACPESIEVAANEVLTSSGLLQDLYQEATVSAKIGAMITKSGSIAKQICLKIVNGSRE